MSEPAERLLVAMRDITAEGGAWASASELAYRAGIGGERRHGNGAVKGSWSGYAAPGLAVSRFLRGMVARGELRAHHPQPRPQNRRLRARTRSR